MSNVHLEDTFDVPGVTPQQCFDYITDVSNAGEWNNFVKSATAEGDLDVGRKVHAKIQFLVPLPFEITTTVTACDIPSRYILTSSVPFTAHLGVYLDADGDGTTCTYMLIMQPTKFFPVPKMVLKRALKMQFDRDGKQLKDSMRALATT